jgi:murein DD-endopeptidase MepM/ murein hydrolase activator NlpD
MQKRAIKRNYAKELRAAKNAAQTTGKAVGFTAKASKFVTAIIRRNPVFLVKAGLFLLIVFLILSMFTMCVGMFSGTSSFVGAVSYSAEDEDIDDASIMYTELETDLRMYINDIEENYPDYDEYRFNIDSIGHDPFALMAFLTAVYEDFTFAEVAATIQAIFDAQYTLELESVMEIREREEERTGTGSWTDEDGNSHSYSYTYTVIVEYEWHILYVTLTSRSFTEVLMERMDADQTQHFHVLMYSKGARQFVGNPFDFDWRPFVTSLYGYRIHPINGGKQFHWGLDIGQPEGTPLLAGFDGVVVYVGYHPTGYGNIVVIECEDGNQARYAHCHEIFVTVGQEVERGEVIATVGNTGASTGAHLHIEVSRNGRRLNPIFFLEFR